MAAIVLVCWFLRLMTFVGFVFLAIVTVPKLLSQKEGGFERIVQVKVKEGAQEKIVTLRSPHVGEHWIGPFDAPVVLLVYTDFDSCHNFCTEFHQELRLLLDAQDPPMAVVYRYSKIKPVYEVMHGAACLAEESGLPAFAEFVDRISTHSMNPVRYTDTDEVVYRKSLNTFGGNIRTYPDEYMPSTMQQLGSDPKKFAECMSSGRHLRRILRDTVEARDAGVYGVPYAFVLNQKKTQGIVVAGMGKSTFKLLRDAILQAQTLN